MNTNNIIRNRGLKSTPQRKFIYDIVQDLGHASIEEIIIKSQLVNPEITVSTIYRIISSFSDCNLLAKVHHPNGKTYYDINTHEHHHIISPEQDLIDLDDPKLTRLIRQRISAQLGAKKQIEAISIQITTSIRE